MHSQMPLALFFFFFFLAKSLFLHQCAQGSRLVPNDSRGGTQSVKNTSGFPFPPTLVGAGKEALICFLTDIKTDDNEPVGSSFFAPAAFGWPNWFALIKGERCV